MQITTAVTTASDTASAAADLVQTLCAALGGPPDWLVLSPTVNYDLEVLRAAIAEALPGCALHGSTSCAGVMTETGYHSADGRALGALGMRDPDGAYGVGMESLGDDPFAAAKQASARAVAAADRPGETPAIVWVTAAPGSEERVIEGIEAFFGPDVPIAGGSSADNAVAGNWKQFTGDEVRADAVIVTAIFPSTEVHFGFHSGYEPTPIKGVVTACEGRRVDAINGEPAAEVYNGWIGGILDDALATGADANILADTTLFPLGRVVGSIRGTDYYMLSHPDSLTAKHGLTFFAEVSVGDEITLMRGTEASLVERAGRVAKGVLAADDADVDQVAGALVIYCAGCMLTVQPKMGEVVTGLCAALGDKPFLGSFTFGEQGCFLGGENRHGNLMISVLVVMQE